MTSLSRRLPKTEIAGEAFDAFLIDIGLSGPHSGLEFVAWVLRQPQCAQTPVIILTGIVSLSEEQEELIRRHRAYVFYKPERLALLIDHLKRVTR